MTCTDCAAAAPVSATTNAIDKSRAERVMRPRTEGREQPASTGEAGLTFRLWAGLVDGVHRRRYATERIGIGGFGALDRGAMDEQLGALLERGDEAGLVVHAGQPGGLVVLDRR